jgi:acyl-CoA synthetase (AMP-forming)/AMP-acid ligase II
VGEVVVSGAHVNRSYWQDSEADSANKLHENGTIWHRTGDTGRLDTSGRLWLVGRVADMVGDLHPFPIEMAAERVEGVGCAALVEHRGRPVLCVEGRGWERAAVVRATGIEAVQAVPRVPMDARHNAKVDRIRLRRMLSAIESG